jgi:hypothetical protein
MIEHVLHPRITENKDWATVLLSLICYYCYHKSVYENRFGDFEFNFSDKYSKVYRDSSQLKVVTIYCSLYKLFQLLFYSIISQYFGYAQKQILFIQIFTFFNFFVLSKF